MAVKLRLSAPLREFTDGADLVEVSGATIGEVLNGLCRSHPNLEPRLFRDDGSLHRFVNVFLDDEDIRFLDNLETPVKEGQEVSIIQAVAGGVGRGVRS